MSIILTMSVKRGASFVAGLSVQAQIDNISPSVIAGSGGMIPLNSFELITFAPYDLRNGDHLYTANQATLLYTISGNPEVFDDHVESVIVKFIQTTP